MASIRSWRPIQMDTCIRRFPDGRLPDAFFAARRFSDLNLADATGHADGFQTVAQRCMTLCRRSPDGHARGRWVPDHNEHPTNLTFLLHSMGLIRCFFVLLDCYECMVTHTFIHIPNIEHCQSSRHWHASMFNYLKHNVQIMINEGDCLPVSSL